MRQVIDTSGSRQVPRHATSLKLVLTTTVCFAIAPGISRALPAFEMAAAIDAPGGKYLVDGNYAAAAGAVAASRSRVSALEGLWLESNACVAHTKLGQYEQASTACDLAVNRASM